MASAPELPKVGDAVADRFELRRVLGEGGMGIVYEAFDRPSKRPCAIKILFPHFCDKPKIIARFDREAQITAKLEGPNVARVFDVGSLPSGVRYIAMELLEGRDLAAELEQRGRLPVATAVDIVMQTAQAMAEAHALGIVHRDLKPDNLFLVASDHAKALERPVVKVLDFGISRLIDDDERLTTDFAQLGTARYMSPEQIEAASRVDKRTDVWSLGVVLYEMVVGRPPFEGQGTAVIVAIATRPVPAPSTLLSDIPPGLEAVVMRALEKSPDARFQSMDELARALAPWAPRGRTYRRRGRRMRVVLFGVAAAAAAVAALTLDPRSMLRLADGSAMAAPQASAAAPGPRASSATSPSRHPPALSPTRRAPTVSGSQTPRDGGRPQAPRNSNGRHP